MAVPRWLAWSVGIVLVASGGLVAAISWEGADRAIHPPRSHPPVTPAARGLAYEDVTFATEDGLSLRGWWAPAAPGAPVVVFLHGYGASKAQSLAVLPFLHRAGYAVLAFDFRAHGASDGDHTTLGLEEVRDLRGALAWLGTRPEADTDRVALFGWSMGAAVALLAGPMPGVRGLVVDSAFAALDQVIDRVLPSSTGLPAFPFATLCVAFASWKVGHEPSEARPADAARDLDAPLLIIQGLDDAVAKESDAEAIHAAAKRSELWLVPSAGHTGARHADPAGYEQHVLSFLKGAFSGAP